MGVLTSKQVSSKSEAESAMAKLAMQDLRNLETGIDAQVNNKQRGKLISNAAVAKSMENGFTREQHYALTANIAALWKHASLVGVFNDEKNGDPNVQIRRFAVPVRFGTEVRYASIMAKETLDEQQHRVYTLEVHGEKTLRGMLNALSAVASKSSTPTRSVDFILTALDAKVNPDAVSKVVDSATGEPLAMYHGTSGNEGGDAFTYFDAYASNYGLAAQIWLAIPARNCGALAGLKSSPTWMRWRSWPYPPQAAAVEWAPRFGHRLARPRPAPALADVFAALNWPQLAEVGWSLFFFTVFFTVFFKKIGYPHREIRFLFPHQVSKGKRAIHSVARFFFFRLCKPEVHRLCTFARPDSRPLPAQ